MTFDLKRWKNRINDGLRDIKTKVTLFAGQSVYGFVATFSLWPIMEALGNGDMAGPVSELVKLIGPVGANLIANQLQQWKDSDEPDLRKKLESALETNQELRDAVDSVLCELKVMSEIRSGLSDEDKIWFQESLQTELSRLGNLERFKVEIEGTGNTVVCGNQNIVAKSITNRFAPDYVEHLETGDKIQGNIVVKAGAGSTIVVREPPVVLSVVDQASVLGRYLSYLISCNRYLQLQGIHSGGKLVNIELEQIYITLRTVRAQTTPTEEEWLSTEHRLMPTERSRSSSTAALKQRAKTAYIKIEEALSDNKRLVVLGDPGSGKTTLLRYLTLMYARDMADASGVVGRRLGMAESGILPIFISLRKLGAFLREHQPRDDGASGYGIVLDFLAVCLKNERISISAEFFDDYLRKNKAVVFLDGLDEVGDEALRMRIARLIDDWSVAYPDIRMVVTSRIVGYSGAARLGEGFVTTTVRDFSLEDVEQFLSYWHRLVAVGQMGPGPTAEHFAEKQTAHLLSSIRTNTRVRELAVNPLMLTVIALVHRDRIKLPERRVEIYAEAVDVLLGNWENAKGLQTEPMLSKRSFDIKNRRKCLQKIAFRMQTDGKKEIGTAELSKQLEKFIEETYDSSDAKQDADRFLSIIRERTGLLVETGRGIYRFSHLTFQEYLAALAVIDRPDCIKFVLERTGAAEWREVILLALGKLGMDKEETECPSELLDHIAKSKKEPLPFHNLVLAVEALHDVGNAVDRKVTKEIQGRVRKILESKQSSLSRMLGKLTVKTWVEEKSRLVEAFTQVGNWYWTMPRGEPEWVPIPEGPFWMGEGEDCHQVHVKAFFISRVPITNVQYFIYVQAEGAMPPSYWEDGKPPKGRHSHPVVNVSWHDATRYCVWLSKVSGKPICLPSEAEWEKTARGGRGKRTYPWGDEFDLSRCNSKELELGTSTPAGIFTSGASPYGVLDMAGNVWEWTRSRWGKDWSTPNFRYPYDPSDGREELSNISHDDIFVLRGGAFDSESEFVRLDFRNRNFPNLRGWNYGFRVVVSPF